MGLGNQVQDMWVVPPPLQSGVMFETPLSAVGMGKTVSSHYYPLDLGISFSRASLLGIAPS